MSEKNYLSYDFIVKDYMENFKRSGTRTGSDFNKYDVPGLKFFKIFFYFDNGNIDSDSIYSVGKTGGLLAPSWLDPNFGSNSYYQYNSAYSYLRMNCEDERANLLKQFITLLSNISSESPWYFAEIGGLDQALTRRQTMDRDFKFEEVRSKISINCLADSVDDRIGTLLDLYRSIVWSWTNKRAILPANLKKFDMGIYIFESPITDLNFGQNKQVVLDEKGVINNISKPTDDKQGDEKSSSIMGAINDVVDSIKDKLFKNEKTHHRASSKYIEFHNCEIDYNSTKNAYAALSNKEGFVQNYTIDIYFDDCYESRYNEFALSEIGDFIQLDLLAQEQIENFIPDEYKVDKADENRAPSTEQSLLQKIKDGVIDQLTTDAFNAAKKFITGKALGNLYTLSLSRVDDYVNMINSGNIVGVASSVLNEAADAFNSLKQKNNTRKKLGNLFDYSLMSNMDDYVDKLKQGNISGAISSIKDDISDASRSAKQKKRSGYVEQLGNLYTSKTIAQNL